MRASWKKLAAVIGSVVLVPQLAAATDLEAQLQQMQERMAQMEDQLQANHDQLEAANDRVAEQSVLIQKAGLEERESKSGLSGFLTDTNFYGWVDASFTQNIYNNHPDGQPGQNTRNALAGSYTSHPDSNTFAVDQVWFGMDKAPTEDSRAGFHIDLLFGKQARTYGGNAGGNGNDFMLFSAYANYMFPVADGLTITAGKMPTIVGAEVVQAPWNFNITRGILWDLQPVVETGATANLQMGGFNALLGTANSNGLAGDAFGTDVDFTKGKSIMAQLGWSNDTFGAAVNYVGGKNNVAAPNGRFYKSNIVDIVLSADPTDALSMWFNFDWIGHRVDPTFAANNGRTDVFGFGLAGRYEVTDKIGLALRGEYQFDRKGALIAGPLASSNIDTQRWTVTLTGDYSFTENLMFRGEFRYDGSTFSDTPAGFNSDIYCGSSFSELGAPCAGAHGQQFAFLADIIYQF